MTDAKIWKCDPKKQENQERLSGSSLPVIRFSTEDDVLSDFSLLPDQSIIKFPSSLI